MWDNMQVQGTRLRQAPLAPIMWFIPLYVVVHNASIIRAHVHSSAASATAGRHGSASESCSTLGAAQQHLQVPHAHHRRHDAGCHLYATREFTSIIVSQCNDHVCQIDASYERCDHSAR